MARKVFLTAYHPWWFRLYVVAVHTFAYLIGMEADTEKLEAQGRKATRYREIIPADEASQ
ncbi:hypothetical protein NTD84_03190 [Pseudomonas sp. 14P_8.1_Bac3]|uniref:hypothetical protein n=1 Tax=Pseudomonas sp. 14P_8.1_Bac3 TaxID=2971621 RepID=UPI0021C77A68|nr:hypothetical protein [Pseudomonas sp. 14P_8.1_Bac3]MCU1758725.1 hypothetical protein [Pseudomonas sp. 14P_8.1_Bac3]